MCVLIYWQVLVYVVRRHVSRMSGMLRYLKKSGSFRACNCIFACHNHQSWNEKKSSIEGSIFVFNAGVSYSWHLPWQPWNHFMTFDQEAFISPLAFKSFAASEEVIWRQNFKMKVGYISRFIISWQCPKKAKFSIWVPKLTLALGKRILPRRSTRQKIIHQVVSKNADLTICIKMLAN